MNRPISHKLMDLFIFLFVFLQLIVQIMKMSTKLISYINNNTIVIM